MDTLEELLFLRACKTGDLEKIKSMTCEDDFDFNCVSLESGCIPALTLAVLGEHIDVVRHLLTIPTLDVNQVDWMNRTPFWYACDACELPNSKLFAICELLLIDQRIDVKACCCEGFTPLLRATGNGNVLLIERLLASGRDLDLSKVNRYSGRTFIEEVYWSYGLHRIHLFEAHINTPFFSSAVRQLHKKYNRDALPATLLAMIVFLSDGLFRIAPPQGATWKPFKVDALGFIVDLRKENLEILENRQATAKRFFCISSKLPLELQMLLANRCYKVPSNLVKFEDRERAFMRLVWFVEQDKPKEN